jgi:Flp pilus assembly protein TadG
MRRDRSYKWQHSVRDASRYQKGTAMIFVLGALVGLFAVSSLAIDVGLIWAARTQLQNASDAAALAGAARLVDASGQVVTLSAAIDASVSLAASNRGASNLSLELARADVVPGNWSQTDEVFDSGVSLSNPELVNAVRVTTRMDDVSNGPVPAIFSRVLGKTGFDVGASAVAYVGYAGGVGPGEVELPIAVDCCKLKGANCESDYCETVATNPPNACNLDTPQADGITSVSCLQFHSTEEQNACWTEFDADSASVSASDLRNVVRDGNATQITGHDPVYLDNGDKANVIREIKNRFYGDGVHSGSPSGTDRYAPYDGVSDSWLTVLPVIECQSETHCSGGEPGLIVGFVCLEIREVEDSPLKLIRGRFLCESDALFPACDIGRTTTGGLDFGLRADIPVLVR